MIKTRIHIGKYLISLSLSFTNLKKKQLLNLIYFNSKNIYTDYLYKWLICVDTYRLT